MVPGPSDIHQRVWIPTATYPLLQGTAGPYTYSMGNERPPAGCDAQAALHRLVSCDSVESGIRSDTAGSASVLEGSIFLDCEDANRTIVRIQRVEEFPIGTDSEVKIRSSGWIRPYNRAGECREASVCCD